MTDNAKDDKPQWIKELEEQPCTCIRCPHCNGSGNVWWLLGKYYGANHPCDDLAELEWCEVCSNGILETCDRCAQLEHYEFEELERLEL